MPTKALFSHGLYLSTCPQKIPTANTTLLLPKGYGIATYPSTPVTPKTLFYGASTSKAFTAATLAIMISSGNYTVPGDKPGTPLAWTTPISDIVPADFVLMDDPWATTHITLEDALSHRTGLPRHDKFNAHFLPDEDNNDGNGGEKRVATPRDVVRMLRFLPLNAAPRTTWQYCNQMFVVASHVIQTLTGRWLGDVLHTWIWAPLGMRATYFSLEDALAAPEHFAGGYLWIAERGEFAEVPYMPTDEVSGAGAVVSCVEDYSRWIQMLLREGAPLSKEGHQAIKTPRMMIDPQSVLYLAAYNGTGPRALPYDAPQSYALGWIVGSYRGLTFWTHSGGMHAYGAEVFFFPALDFGVVTFGNTAGTSNYVGLLAVWQLVDDRLGVPEEERYPWELVYVPISLRHDTAEGERKREETELRRKICWLILWSSLQVPRQGQDFGRPHRQRHQQNLPRPTFSTRPTYAALEFLRRHVLSPRVPEFYAGRFGGRLRSQSQRRVVADHQRFRARYR